MTGQTLTTLPEILGTLLGKQLPLHTCSRQPAVAAPLLFIACQGPVTINALPQPRLALPSVCWPCLDPSVFCSAEIPMQTVAMEATRLGAMTAGATAHPLPRLLVAMTVVMMTDMHAGPHPCVMPTEGLTPMQRLAAAGSSCCLADGQGCTSTVVRADTQFHLARAAADWGRPLEPAAAHTRRDLPAQSEQAGRSTVHLCVSLA